MNGVYLYFVNKHLSSWLLLRLLTLQKPFYSWSKLKAFADDKMYVNEKLKFGLEKEENIVGKGDNAGFQHCLLFPQCFLHPSVSGLLKVRIVW